MSNLGTFQRYVERQASAAVAAGAAIPELTALGIPGADGVRRYMANVTISAGKALNFYEIHLGPLGTVADPTLFFVATENRNVAQWQTVSSGVIEVLVPATGAPPASTDLLTVSVFAWGGAANNLVGGKAGPIALPSTVWVGEYMYRRQLGY